MTASAPKAFTYELQSIIRNAPSHSGIFALFAWDTCVFVGEAADIRASLLAIHDAANPCLTRASLTHFTAELVASGARVERRAARIRELIPVCNLAVGSPDCRVCSLAPRSDPGDCARLSGMC